MINKSLNKRNSPILVAKVLGVSWNCAELFAIAAQYLWVKSVLASTAITERLHHWIDFLLKDFGELQTEILIRQFHHSFS